jgi:hypothetical protein
MSHLFRLKGACEKGVPARYIGSFCGTGAPSSQRALGRHQWSSLSRSRRHRPRASSWPHARSICDLGPRRRCYFLCKCMSCRCLNYGSPSSCFAIFDPESHLLLSLTTVYQRIIICIPICSFGSQPWMAMMNCSSEPPSALLCAAVRLGALIALASTRCHSNSAVA